MKRPLIQPLLTVATIFLVMAPTRAFAYLDPGTGSLILQALIGALVAVSVGIASIRHKIARFFRPRSDSSDNESDDKSET